MKIPQSIREEIEKAPLAQLTTLNPDGAPQVTVVWVGLEGEEFVMGHLALHQKIKNIRRDSRVVLSFLGDKTSENGLREYVVVHGHARITDGGAVPLLSRLAPLYLGNGAEYPPPSMRSIAGYVTRSHRHGLPASALGLDKLLCNGSEVKAVSIGTSSLT